MFPGGPSRLPPIRPVAFATRGARPQARPRRRTAAKQSGGDRGNVHPEHGLWRNASADSGAPGRAQRRTGAHRGGSMPGPTTREDRRVDRLRGVPGVVPAPGVAPPRPGARDDHPTPPGRRAGLPAPGSGRPRAPGASARTPHRGPGAPRTERSGREGIVSSLATGYGESHQQTPAHRAALGRRTGGASAARSGGNGGLPTRVGTSRTGARVDRPPVPPDRIAGRAHRGRNEPDAKGGVSLVATGYGESHQQIPAHRAALGRRTRGASGASGRATAVPGDGLSAREAGALQ